MIARSSTLISAASGKLTSAVLPATGIAAILPVPGSCARPSRAVPPGLVAELSCQKIVFDLQLADLPVQKIGLGFVDGSLRRSAALEDARRTVQQLLFPVLDLVRVDPKPPRQLGDGPVALDRRQRHLRLEPRTVLLPCPLHVPLPRSPRFLGAGVTLSTSLLFGVQLRASTISVVEGIARCSLEVTTFTKESPASRCIMRAPAREEAWP